MNKLKVGIMQPYFFPYLGYFQLINGVDKFVLLDDVNYIKKGWINKNRILINGQVNNINVQLLKISQNRKINEINLDSNREWRVKLLKTITMSYSRAQNFDVIYSVINKIIESKVDTIAELNYLSIMEVCNYLCIDTKIISSSAIFNNDDLSGEDRIIDICLQLGATNYLNAIGGKELYNNLNFDKVGIGLNFLEPKLPYYKQLRTNEFLPGLSIIDILMNNQKSIIQDMLNEYKLI